jgi:hypothetical protein
MGPFANPNKEPPMIQHLPLQINDTDSLRLQWKGGCQVEVGYWRQSGTYARSEPYRF